MPARFQLVGALNPCPCGRSGQPRLACRCTPGEVRGYLGRLSGPLLDRLDLHVSVPALAFDEAAGPPGEASAAMRARVAAARERQSGRQSPSNSQHFNAFLPSAELRQVARPDSGGLKLLRHAVDRLGLSARGLDRVSRVARTISDLAESDRVKEEHLAEALHFRQCLDEPLTLPLTTC